MKMELIELSEKYSNGQLELERVYLENKNHMQLLENIRQEYSIKENNQINEKSNYQMQIGNINEQFQELQLNYTQLNMNLSNALQELESVRKHEIQLMNDVANSKSIITVQEIQIKDATNQYNVLLKDHGKLIKELSISDDLLNSLRSELDSKSKLHLEANEEIKILLDKRMQDNQIIISLENELVDLREQYKQLNVNETKANNLLDERNEELKTFIANMDALKIDYENKIAKLNENFNHSMKQVTNNMNDVTNDRLQLQQQLHQYASRVNSLEKEKFAFELKLNSNNVNLEQNELKLYSMSEELTKVNSKLSEVSLLNNTQELKLFSLTDELKIECQRNSELKFKVDNLVTELHESTVRNNELEVKLTNAKNDLQNVSRYNIELDAKFQQLQSNQAALESNLNNRIKELLETSSENDKTIEELKNNIKKSQSNMKLLQEKFEKSNENNVSLSLHVSEIEKNLDQLQTDYEMMNEKHIIELENKNIIIHTLEINKVELLESLHSCEDDNGNLKVRMNQLENQVADYLSKIDSSLSEKLSLQSELHSLMDSNASKQDTIQSNISVLKEVEDKNNLLSKALSELEIKEQELRHTCQEYVLTIETMKIAMLESQAECNEIRNQLITTKEFYSKSVELIRTDYQNKTECTNAAHQSLMIEMKQQLEEFKVDCERRIVESNQALTLSHHGELTSANVKYLELKEEFNNISMQVSYDEKCKTSLLLELQRLSDIITNTNDANAGINNKLTVNERMNSVFQHLECLFEESLALFPIIVLVCSRMHLSESFINEITTLHSTFVVERNNNIATNNKNSLLFIIQHVRRILNKLSLLCYNKQQEYLETTAIDNNRMESIVLSATNELDELDSTNRDLRIENIDLLRQVRELEKSMKFLNIKLNSKEEILVSKVLYVICICL